MSTKEAVSLARLNVAVNALGDVDVTGWSDDTLRIHLNKLSAALCQVDAELSRVADAVRARGFRVEEPASARRLEAAPARRLEAAVAGG